MSVAPVLLTAEDGSLSTVNCLLQKREPFSSVGLHLVDHAPIFDKDDFIEPFAQFARLGVLKEDRVAQFQGRRARRRCPCSRRRRPNPQKPEGVSGF